MQQLAIHLEALAAYQAIWETAINSPVHGMTTTSTPDTTHLSPNRGLQSVGLYVVLVYHCTRQLYIQDPSLVLASTFENTTAEYWENIPEKKFSFSQCQNEPYPEIFRPSSMVPSIGIMYDASFYKEYK